LRQPGIAVSALAPLDAPEAARGVDRERRGHGRPDRDGLAAAVFALVVACGLCVWCIRVNGATPLINDELCYLWQARVLTTGRVTSIAPAHPEFVNIPPLFIRENRRFSQYPLGFPLVLAPWEAAGAPWAANAALAGLALVLLHRFARRVGGRAVAWIAIVLTALSPFFVAQSTVFMSHPLTLALTLALLVALERRESAPARLRWPVLAGTTIGLAGNVSPFVAVPMALVCVDRLAATRHARPVGRREAAAFVLPILGGLLLFGLTNVATTGVPWTPAYFLRSYVRAGFGEEVGLGGYSIAKAIANTRDRIRLLDEMLFGWPGSSFLFAAPYAAVALARSLVRRPPRDGPRGREPERAGPRDRWDRALAVLFVGTVAVYALWYSPGTAANMGPRFLYAALPTLALFTARGVVGLAGVAEQAADRCADLGARALSRGSGADRPPRRFAAAGTAVASAVVTALVLGGTVRYVARMPTLEKPRERRGVRALLHHLEHRGVRRGTVFLETSSAMKGPPLLFVSRFDDAGDLVFARDLGRRKNRAFLASRDAGPVFTATFDPVTLGWTLQERAPD
jgi:hypothetical protein